VSRALGIVGALSLNANSHGHARHDKAVSPVSRPLRRCELYSRQLKTVARPIENLKPGHVQSSRSIPTGTPDTTQTGPSCRVWCGGVNWALRRRSGTLYIALLFDPSVPFLFRRDISRAAAAASIVSSGNRCRHQQCAFPGTDFGIY